MNVRTTCPNCLRSDMEIFHRARGVPANSCILLASQEEAHSYPQGDIVLGFCPECGFISNLAYDAGLTEYSQRYEETQGFSPTFNAFHRQLAQRLIDRCDLRNKDVLEIGCGKGEFLMLLAELGNNRGLGFDPGYVEARNVSPAADRVTFVKDFYSEKYADCKADLLCCKMTLEHISETATFVGMIRKAIGNRLDTRVFIQVPDATRIFRECAFEDIYYEHCSYFTPGSLARLFRKCGFEILSLESEYDGQYQAIVARPVDGHMSDQAGELGMGEMKRFITAFPGRFEEKVRWWRQRLDLHHMERRKVVLWGSGSKGVAFLSTLGIKDRVEYVVDINPYRQGYFMPGTGQKIVSPEFLADYRPDLVVVMNAIYRGEISSQLQSLGLQPEIVTA